MQAFELDTGKMGYGFVEVTYARPKAKEQLSPYGSWLALDARTAALSEVLTERFPNGQLMGAHRLHMGWLWSACEESYL